MRAFGSDRVRPGKGEQMILFCRRSKGWTPRVPKTLTRAEHPGTAVLWEDRFFEVVSEEKGTEGGVRYVLEPWRDNHVIRVSEPYDEASESRREADHRASAVRQKSRKAANLAGMFTGHLPAVVQDYLGSEIGILPTKLTALSLILPFLFLVWLLNDYARRTMDPNAPPMPLALLLIGGYLFIESGIRLNIVWLHRRPIGSAAGLFAYLIYYIAVGRYSGAISPFTKVRGHQLYITQPPDDVALQDAFAMREPLLTLLSPAEQAAMAERFGFNYRKHASIVALVLLGFSSAGVITSLVSLQQGPRLSAIVSLILAGIVGAEQVFRLGALQRGPAGSVLAIVVRPFARKLFR
jgi:hypothetical protein